MYSREKYKKIITQKRNEKDYISTKDILDIIEQAIKESKNGYTSHPYTKTNAISGQDNRGVK